MIHPVRHIGLSLLSFGLVLGAPAAAQQGGNAPAATTEEQLRRLEALLEAQQRKIEALESQVRTKNDRDADLARAEVMRRQIREILSDEEFRESLMPSTLMAGYDNGFYLRSSDDQFLFRINGRMQFRWTHYATRARNRYLLPRRERDDRTGFDFQRIRLALSGHAWSPDTQYYIEMKADAGGSYDVVLHEAWINQRFADEFQMKAGVFRLASTRSQFNGDSSLQLVDRPMVDAVFGLGIGLGVRFWGQLFDKRLEYFVDVVNSTGDDRTAALGRTITVDPAELDSNPGILFRTVWHALGAKPAVMRYQADTDHVEDLHLDLGFHYAFNDDYGDRATTRLPFNRDSLQPGGFGLTTINGTQINQFGFDAALKYAGFSLTGEYMLRLVDPRRANRAPFTPLTLLTGEESTVAQHGAYLQGGYMLPIPGLENKLEAVARIGAVAINTSGSECAWEYAGGLNYYLDGQKRKIQFDVTKVTEAPTSSGGSSLANVNDDALVFRVQLQLAF